MRFHFGISFRWKTIKKFLFPFAFGLLAYFGFGGIFDNFNLGFIQTYAYNMTSYYNVDMFDYKTYLENSSCDDTNLYEFLNNYINSINWSNSYNQIFISINLGYDHTPTDLRLYFVPTSSVNQNQGHKIWTFGLNQSSGWGPIFKAEASKQYVGSLVINKDSCNNTTNLQSVLDFITTTANTGAPSNSFYTPGFNYSNGTGYYNVTWANYNSFSDSSSYNVGGWWYYSSYDLYFASSSEAGGNNKYWKTIHINDNNQNYGFDSKLPSYRDIYPYTPTPVFIGYKKQLDTLYTRFSPSQLSNYDLQINFKVPQSVLGFYQTPEEYIDNTQFDYICSGRVSSGGYYYYESFPCSLSSSYTTTQNTITYIFNNVTTSSNLSNYDTLYVTINPKYIDSNVSTTMFNLNYTFTNGYFYNTSYKGAIYERLSGLLTLDFKLYFSSNNSPNNANLYIDTTNFDNTIFTMGFSNTSHKEFYQIGQSVLGNPDNYEELEHFRLTRVSNSFDTGVMVYQQNGSTRLSYLNLFFNDGMYISSNLGNDNFYYIDNTGTIQNGSFSPPVLSNNDDDFDITYYTNYVSSFIDDLSDSSLTIAIYTQSFFDSIPIVLQTFILVMFILACIYFVYLLIKR